MSRLTPPVAVAVLDRALDWACGCLELARSTPLEAPTPCRGWDLGRLLDHLEDSVATLGEAAEAGRVGVAERLERGAGPNGEPVPGPDGEPPVERLLRRTRRTRAAWQHRRTSAPVTVEGLALGRDTVALVGALEVVVHAWDVACAAESPRPLPDELAEQLLPVALAVVTADERGRRFGPVVPLPPGSGPGQRLLAHLGREPGPAGSGAAGSGAAGSGRAGWSDGTDAGHR